MTGDEPEADSLLDAIALVSAMRRDDRAGVSAIIMNSSWFDVMIVLARFCAEFCEEEHVDPAYWREWARQAANRGLHSYRYARA